MVLYEYYSSGTRPIHKLYKVTRCISVFNYCLLEVIVSSCQYFDNMIYMKPEERYVGSPGKNGTYRKSIQRRLIIIFIHSSI